MTPRDEHDVGAIFGCGDEVRYVLIGELVPDDKTEHLRKWLHGFSACRSTMILLQVQSHHGQAVAR